MHLLKFKLNLKLNKPSISEEIKNKFTKIYKGIVKLYLKSLKLLHLLILYEKFF